MEVDSKVILFICLILIDSKFLLKLFYAQMAVLPSKVATYRLVDFYTDLTATDEKRYLMQSGPFKASGIPGANVLRGTQNNVDNVIARQIWYEY